MNKELFGRGPSCATFDCEHTMECSECGYTIFGDEPRHIVTCSICELDWTTPIVDDDPRSAMLANLLHQGEAYSDLPDKVQSFISEEDYNTQQDEIQPERPKADSDIRRMYPELASAIDRDYPERRKSMRRSTDALIHELAAGHRCSSCTGSRAES